MAQRDVTVAMSSDTSGFSKGIQQAKKILTELNKTLIDNQSTLKAATRELNNYEKEQQELQEEMDKSGNDIEENRKKMAQLTEKIKEQKEKVAQLKTEQIEIRGQISRATTALKNETKAVEEAAQKNDNLSDGFTVLKGAISNLVSDALNVAIDKFKEMSVSAEQSLNSLQVKTGMSAEAVGELKDEMYDIYKNNFGDSLTDVADKMALVTQNIDESDPEKIKSITEKAIGLSDAFGSDFEENLRGVNGLMTNMGLTADEAFDYIAKGSQNGLDKTHELTDNLAEYSQIWGQAGFSAQEMFSILQNGLDSGAYTLDKVNDYVGEFGKALADGRMAENITNFSSETQNLFTAWKNGGATTADVFKSAISNLSNMANQQKALTIATETWGSLGEDNAMSVITALNNVNDTYNDVAGTMQEINDIQYEDVGSQVEALGRQFEVDILQPIVEQASPKIKEFITWVSNNLPLATSVLAELVAGVVAFKTATVAGNFLKTIIEGFKSLKPTIEGATEAQLANNAATKANFYVALASTIFSAVTALTTFIVTLNSSSSAVTAATFEVKNYAQALNDAKSSAKDKEATAESEISLLNTQKERYDELRKKVNLTTQEKNELNNIASDVAKTLGTTTDALKDESGAYGDITENVKNYIEQLRIKLQLENAQDILKEAYNVRDNGATEERIKEAKEAYDDYANEMLKKIKDSNTNLKDELENGDITELQALHDKNTIEMLGGDYTKLIQLEHTYADLNSQRVNAIGTIEEYEGKVSDLYGKLKNESEATDESTESIKNKTEAVEELSKTMSEMSAKTTAVTNAEKEYEETQTLTASTLQSVIDKYPELEDEVNKYMLGIIDEKELIQSMKNVYQGDLDSYIGVIAQKASNSNTFYNQLINANANFVNKAKEQYGIDLMNFKNLQEAKAAMVANAVSKVQGPTQMGTVDFSKSVLGYGQVNESSWQYKVAENIVDSFINSSISATTDYTKFFSSPSGSGSGSGGSSGNSGGSSKTDNKYELASEAYNRLVDKRIEKIEKEAEAAEKAKDKKIAAIDAEIEARKRLNEDADRQAELDEINARLEYDQLSKLDRRELERKRQDLLNEQAEINWERSMQDKKDKIESDYSKQEQSYSSAMEALQQAAESAKNYFSKLAGTQTSSQIVNNNSDTRNIQIIANALSNQQMLDKLLNALYSK